MAGKIVKPRPVSSLPNRPPQAVVHSPYVRMSGYSESGASTERRALKGMVPNSGSPNRDILENLQTLRERSRMLYMSASPATSSIKTCRTNVIGVGLIPKPAVDADALGINPEQAAAFERQAAREFAVWAESKGADALRLNDFYEMQSLALSSMLMSGDVFAVIERGQRTRMEPYSLRLHLIEADRCRTPNGTIAFTVEGEAENGNKIYDGVEVDNAGRVVAYHIANTYPHEYASGKATEFQRVEAIGKRTGLPNVLHLMCSERCDQYRGVPFLANCIEQLLQIRRYTEAELSAALVQSFFTAFITTEADPEEFGETVAEGEAPEGISRDPNEYELGPATVNFLRPGESATGLQPTHPNTGFDTFINAMCQQVGASLEIPSDLLMKKFGESYSASRAELLEAWKMFSMYRRWFINDFCRPIYEIWMTEAIALGRLSAPGFFDDPVIKRAWLGCEWIGPAQGQLDPVKEINASILAVQHGFSTHEAEATKYNGSQFETNVTKLAAENSRLTDAMPVIEQTGQNEGDETNGEDAESADE